ncbi:uncharacterized protein F4822DRAFT_440780 [Hypoxylon trugodes]|uniref:uncharacterized protein n=1 Tax=Hypoxylon trugodes TaxID=326681 RepID=UPI00219B21A3|nr:uncharacterized protein F4822DRAFT_440780 [Hypoxylon trugodes]KAI1383098.1 hypothetical protein F4822DRAFT_440780 [Hypoxylon trugodes]
MPHYSRPASPFSRALQQWISELKRDEDKKTKFYEKVLATQNELQTTSESNQCERHAQDLSKYIEELQEKKRSKSRFIRLCSKLEPFISSLTNLMTICGEMSQSASPEVGIAFGAAKLVLQLASKQAAAFDRIVDIMVEIARNLRCYDKFSVAYEKSEELQDLLLEAYKAIIVFWQRASQILDRSLIRIAAINMVKPIDVEWKECLGKLQNNSRAVSMLAQATTAAESRENEALNLTKKIAKWISGGEDISKLLFRSDLRDIHDIRQDGTCNWIFEQESFKSWYEAKESTVAWYHAPPGSGKTVLSTVVAYHLQENNQVVYYRYSYDDPTRKNPLTALRSIALQLRTIQGRIPDQAEECYKEEVEHHAYQLQDPEVAIQVVEAFIAQMPRIHIIIDGLDECSDVEKALSMFRRLTRLDTCGIAKWFFTSLNEAPIRNIMEEVQAIEISPPTGAIGDDIGVFLSSRGEKLARQTCAECVRYYTASSEENFLYSTLMFNILCGDGITCNDEIHDELQKFPRKLTGCYTRCLQNIARRAEPERNLARRIFLFMVYAKKPLTVKELCNALAIMKGIEYDDHQPNRVPCLEVIQSLGGSLIKLEKSSDEAENDPKVKFVHKSVQDYFKEDLDRIGIPKDRADLRYFFISGKEGNLELGQYCLKYLQFKRYQSKVDIPMILANNEEHAFLKYAAAFWFEHLNQADNSEELFLEVKSLVESVAFSTCLAVQVKVRPHLFARYTNIRGTAVALRLESGELGRLDSIAVPLPDWVEFYEPGGCNISRMLYNFIREWHETLIRHPEAASSYCQTDQAGSRVLPGLASMMSKNMRISAIRVPSEASDVALSSTFYEKSKPHACITYVDGDTTRWQEGPISAGVLSKSGIIPMESRREKAGRLIRFSEQLHSPHPTDPVTWSIPLANLEVEHYYEGKTRAFRAPDLCRASDSSTMGWILVTESKSASADWSALAFHLTSTRSEEAKKQDVDSGYDSASDTDGGWSVSDGDTSDDEDSETLVSDCLLLCCDGENPIWIPWLNDRSQISCAFHPNRKIAVCSRSLDEIQIIDLSTGEISSRAIEEPAAARSLAPINCREMRFSPCGRYIYYLLIMIDNNGDIGSTCQVFLSVFPFEESSENDMMRPCVEVQRLTYKLGAQTNKLRAPYVLTHWDVDMVYLCLPLLSCNPKVVRLHLVKGDTEEEAQIQTLTNPAFFPNSTPSRNPRIIYHSSKPGNKENKDRLALALDGVYHSVEEGGNNYPPTVIEWKIDGKKGWRTWDEASDSEDPQLVEETRTYAQLRGDFINADRRFNVVVRNSLDWTRKAYLSCA